MGILLTVLTAITTLFVSGSQAELDANRRFQAQQEARLATDRLRRDVHCSSGVTLTSAASITVALPAQCPSAGGTAVNVVYDTQLVAASRYRLRRAGVQVADYLTTANVFSYVAPSSSSLAKLHVDLPVNVKPQEGWKQWRLVSDVVLRNTVRS